MSEQGDHNLELARQSLSTLLEDQRLPKAVRESLASDYEAVRAMLDKIEKGHLHVAAFGRVSTGKSSLLNALVGSEVFSVSPLHGETKQASIAQLETRSAGGVFVIDTPGIDEADGESRESIANEVARRADIILFTVDSDLTETEFLALGELTALGPPVLLVLNKMDRYTTQELEILLNALRKRSAELISGDRVVAVSAQPKSVSVVVVDENGNEREELRERAPDLEALREAIWNIVEHDGKTLAALNASLFAADLSDKVGVRLVAARSELAERLVRTYCIGKGIAVGLNPVPVADLLAAAAIDVGMIMHLSQVFGLPMSRNDAGKLV
ncbi:MAG: GTPase, partial [Pseudomonadota bacterium]